MIGPLDHGPIFITGLDHSGKTRLRLLLGRSRRLSLTRRTELWTSPHAAHGDLSDDRSLDACIVSLLARRPVAEMVPEPDALRVAFRTGPATHGRLFALIHEMHAARRGAERWGDQDSGLELVSARVLAELPTARVVHLVIDPRRRFASMERSVLARPGMVGAATAAWVASVRRGTEAAARDPSRYRLIRAETIEDGTGTADLLGYLGLRDLGHIAEGGPESHAPSRIRDRDRAFVESTAREEMASLGYAIEGRLLAGADRLRAIALHRPLGTVRYGLRMIRERASEARIRRRGEAS